MGTFETCRWPLTKSVVEGKADFRDARTTVSVWTRCGSRSVWLWQGGNMHDYYFGSKLLAWLAPPPDGPVETVPVPEPKPGETRN
jgi:hypothetical protein